MNYYKILFILLLIGLLFNGMTAEKPVLAQTDTTAVTEQVVVYTPGEGDDPVPSAITGYTDLVHQGTAWVAEKRYQLSLFKPYGWGTEVKAKAAGDQWVHIAVPYISILDGTAIKLQYAEVCGTSSNGAATKPTKIDLWRNTLRIGSYTIAWPADNAYHCAGVTLAVPDWKDSVGISVLLHFANTTDKITLAKAWVRLVP